MHLQVRTRESIRTDGMKVVNVAAHGTRGYRYRSDLEFAESRRRARQQAHLNQTRLLERILQFQSAEILDDCIVKRRKHGRHRQNACTDPAPRLQRSPAGTRPLSSNLRKAEAPPPPGHEASRSMEIRHRDCESNRVHLMRSGTNSPQVHIKPVES